jgi:hypothetical protein
MYRYTLTVPTHDNNGAPFDQALLDGVDRLLSQTYDGFTRVDATGAWDGGFRMYSEPVRVYSIDASEHALDSLRNYALFLAQALSQECIYLTRQPIETWLLAPADDLTTTPAKEDA